MKQSSENLWKQILAELADQELSAVPRDEEIRKMHIFSERFLRNMKPILAMGMQETKQESLGAPQREKEKRQSGIRALAASIVCALVLGVVLTAWNGTFSLRMGSSSASLGSADTAGITEESAETTDEASAEASDDNDSTTSSDSVASDSGASGQGSWNEPMEEASQGAVRMVMLDGKLYVDTGEHSSITGRCGVMDFQFDSLVASGEPTENGQTNFGTGFCGQYGTRSNRIEICIDDEWLVFAYQENDLADVSLTVEEVAADSLTLSLQNDSDSELTFGQQYQLELYDEEMDAWTSVTDVTDFAYEDIAYFAEPGETVKETVTADWSEKYAVLEAGYYRIVKTITVADAPEESAEHTLTAEFTID